MEALPTSARSISGDAHSSVAGLSRRFPSDTTVKLSPQPVRHEDRAGDPADGRRVRAVAGRGTRRTGGQA